MSERILSLLGGGDTAEWIRTHLDYSEERWCLIWPYALNQGGYANYNGLIVSRIMCEWRNGPPPPDKPEAAHECGRGREGCVNPTHLTWKSHSENMADTYAHGKRPRRYKLTPEDVDEIRSLEGRMRLRDIAEKFNVSDVTIRQIHKGQIWKNPHPAQHFLTDEQLERIRSAKREWGKGVIESLAEEFGISSSLVYRIRRGELKRFELNSQHPPQDRATISKDQQK